MLYSCSFVFGVMIELYCISISAVVCCFDFLQTGSTAVHCAAKYGIKDVLKFLLEKFASVNAETNVSMNGKGRIEVKITGVPSK